MPNWCSTKIIFESDTISVKPLYDKLIHAISHELVESDFGPIWLGNILANFDMTDCIDKYDCRGTIAHIESYSTNKNSFNITTDTAWRPMIKMWQAIIGKWYAGNIKISWLAEEIGNCLYLSNNLSAFDEIAYIDWEIANDKSTYGDRQYCESIDDIVCTVNDIITAYHLPINFISENDVKTQKSQHIAIYEHDSSYIFVTMLALAKDSDIL